MPQLVPIPVSAQVLFIPALQPLTVHAVVFSHRHSGHGMAVQVVLEKIEPAPWTSSSHVPPCRTRCPRSALSCGLSIADASPAPPCCYVLDNPRLLAKPAKVKWRPVNAFQLWRDGFVSKIPNVTQGESRASLLAMPSPSNVMEHKEMPL